MNLSPSISNKQMGKIYMFLSLLFVALNSSAQSYQNQVFVPAIKTVEFYNTAKVQSMPIITLRGTDQLLLAFDDLRGGSRYYTYTIEHCDGDWNPSHLSPTEYLESFTEDRLDNYQYSTNTLQKYTHYQLTLPNRNIIPKVSGNYILKVYEDSDPNKQVLTRRFYVVENKVSIGADIQPSPNTALRQSNQKINFQVDYGNLQVQNPTTDIRVLVMQNARPDKSIWNTNPQYIRGNQLVFNDVSTNDFTAGNEFRHVDLRSLKLNSDRVGRIYRDTANTVMLLGDPNRDKENYLFQYDNNGSFFILNQDQSRDPRIDADYAHVYFSLAANKTDKEGDAYIAGKFNDYRFNDQSRLQYDNVKGRFYTDLFLKQGVYDYEYIWVSNSTKLPDDTALEGSYFDTENDYQLLVYYHRIGARYEELVGYRVLNTSRR
jgi:hypothetical protein